jgi:hypothetical protein
MEPSIPNPEQGIHVMAASYDLFIDPHRKIVKLPQAYRRNFMTLASLASWPTALFGAQTHVQQGHH